MIPAIGSILCRGAPCGCPPEGGGPVHPEVDLLAPVSVSLVKPAAIDTPFPEHARSYLDEEPKLPPPVYAPEEVAHAILTCAEKPVRDVVVGGGGRMMTAMGNTAPRLTDRYMEAAMFEQQRSDELAALDRPDALYTPMRGSGREHGDYEGHVLRTSAYTRASLNPGMAIVVLSLLGLTLALATRPALR